jgi:AraC-like DNA-binding protein
LKNKNSSLPVYELRHENEEVAFAIRSTQAVIEMFGRVTDKPHRHNYYTVMWSYNYSGKHIVDYHEYEIRPNDIFFVNPGQVHQVKHTGKPEGTVILFTCEFMEKNAISESFVSNLNLFSEISSSPPIRVNEESASKLKKLVDQMLEVFLTNDPFKDDLIGAYLKLFLIECNKFALAPTTQNTQTIQSGKILVKKFKDLLEERYFEWKKVNEYADDLNISSDYLNNVVRNTVGKTAKELIQQRVVLEAKRLGLHTDLTTKEIAYRLGFEDPSHFSKFFKNVDGSSFSAFRTSLIEELSA